MRVILSFIIIFALCVGCTQSPQESSSGHLSTLAEVRSKQELKIGYAIYPPYIEKNLNTGDVSGFSIDVARELAKEMGVKPVFIESTWNTFIADTKMGKFNIFVGPVYHSVKRLMEVDLPEPYGFFSAVAGLVKKNDDRFHEVTDLDKEGIVISVPSAWTSHEYVQRFFTKPTVKAFKQDGAAMVFADLVAGNCDVALADAPTVQQYIEKNPNQDVKPVFLDKPVSFVRAGFMVQKGDPEWLEFISESVRIMRTEGTIRGLAQKHKLYSFEEDVRYIKQ